MTNGIRGFKPAAWLIGMLGLIAAVAPLACTPGPDVEVVEHPLAEFDFMAEPWAEPGAEIPERHELPFRVEVTAVADSEAFSRPGHGYIDPAGSERFVVDYYNATVLLLTENLDVVTVYGKGRGDGPGEMQNPIGIALDDDRRVYVADAYSRRVRIFAPDGRPQASIPLESQAIGMIRGGAGVVVFTTSAEKSFRTYLFEDLLKAEPPEPTLEFGDLGTATARSGATARDIAGALSPVFRTRFPSAYVDLGDDVQTPIRIAMAGAEALDVDRVVARPLAVNDSLSVRLAGLAPYVVEERPSGIQRIDQRYRRFVNVDFRGPAQMANDFIEAALAAFAVPVGYDLGRARYSFFTEDVAEQYAWVLWATILLVFVVTAAVFESWTLPVVVLLSVPTAAIGVAAGFLWSGASFAEGAFIGTILLVGIAVNDSILLVDRYRQLRALRPSATGSVLARLAVRQRLRPMLTTTLTSIVTMLPMLLFPDDGDFWMGLAVTVIGGLAASTLFAPVVGVAALSLGKRRRVDSSIERSIRREEVPHDQSLGR